MFRIRVMFLVALVALCAACGSGAPSVGDGATSQGGRAGQKTLRVTIQAQPSTFVGTATGGVTPVGGRNQITALAHDWLTYTDIDGTAKAALAEEQPSLDRGTWTVNADGTMVTTWRLRSGVTWQDGAPFIADDLVFGWEIATNANVLAAGSAQARAASAVEAVDSNTLRITWRRVAPDADDLGPGTIEPLPRRLLADALASPTTFLANPYFTGRFIGLGPFRVVRWVEGSFIEFARYDGYWRGAPPLDGITVRFISDPNAQLAAVLAGDVDVVLPVGVDIQSAGIARQRWQGTANQIIAAPDDRLEYVAVQLRPGDQTQPSLLDPRVRRALTLAIDRQQLVDVVTAGEGLVADGLIPPWRAERVALAASIPPVRYDPAAAAQDLAGLGWRRGVDGIMRSPSGEPLAFPVNTLPTAHSEEERALVADNWTQLGVQIDQQLQSAATIRDLETVARLPGTQVTASLYQLLWTVRFHTREIARPENRWAGNNLSGYSNPVVDTLLDRLATAIAPQEHLALLRDLTSAIQADQPIMPLFWDMNPILALAPVRNLKPYPVLQTTNAYEWDLR